VVGRLGIVLDMLAGTMGNHPMGRPMRRTAKAFLREMEEKVRAGEISAETIRGKVSEFATAISWISEAPAVIAGQSGEPTTASILGDAGQDNLSA
jgi:hypothetical protein